MTVDESVTLWIKGLREGSPRSAQELWERYFQRLVEVADRRLPRSVKRDFDEEDVALSAFHSLCRGVAKGRFPQLQDRHNLWSLLVVITARKVMHRLRDATAAKRGGGRVVGESALDGREATSGGPGINQIIGHEPTADFAVQVCEESERLLELLPDEGMRRLAVLKMEGYTNEEAAERLGCGVRTIERRLSLIRRVWKTRGDRYD
jgi:DNA-directed RNA polymerase specialized sigma24 family protein